MKPDKEQKRCILVTENKKKDIRLNGWHYTFIKDILLITT